MKNPKQAINVPNQQMNMGQYGTMQKDSLKF